MKYIKGDLVEWYCEQPFSGFSERTYYPARVVKYWKEDNPSTQHEDMLLIAIQEATFWTKEKYISPQMFI